MSKVMPVKEVVRCLGHLLRTADMSPHDRRTAQNALAALDQYDGNAVSHLECAARRRNHLDARIKTHGAEDKGTSYDRKEAVMLAWVLDRG